MSLTDEMRKFELRVREAPEVVGLNPVEQRSRYQVATIAVLIDLLLSTIRPDHFDEKLLTPIENAAERGESLAISHLRWLKLWTAGTDSVPSTASDAEIADLLESGRHLVSRLYLLANYSNDVTGEPRYATLHRTLSRILAEENSYLAGSCLVYLQIALEDVGDAMGSGRDS